MKEEIQRRRHLIAYKHVKKVNTVGGETLTKQRIE